MANANEYQNPPFDVRTYSLTGLTPANSGVLQRGYITQNYSLTGGGVIFTTRFLYNPSLISVSHSTDVASSNAVMPQVYRNSLDTSTPNIPVNATVAFALLFDRTYELWDPASNPPNPYDTALAPGLAGVVADVAALYRTVGIMTPTVVNGSITGQQNSLATQYNTSHIPVPSGRTALLGQGAIGPMPLTPVTVYFGGQNSLSYSGYVNSLSIDYTHFSQLMVPFRCTANVSLQIIPATSWGG